MKNLNLQTQAITGPFNKAHSLPCPRVLGFFQKTQQPGGYLGMHGFPPSRAQLTSRFLQKGKRSPAFCPASQTLCAELGIHWRPAGLACRHRALTLTGTSTAALRGRSKASKRLKSIMRAHKRREAGICDEPPQQEALSPETRKVEWKWEENEKREISTQSKMSAVRSWSYPNCSPF